MHRSGTSALGGALEALGLTVGKTVMPPSAKQGNPNGYYENLALTNLHNEFLASIKSSWHDHTPVPDKQFSGMTARHFRRELLQLLVREFESGRPLIKDPRLCRLMPLWLPVIKEYFPQAYFILPIRHPVEVACSLNKRDQFPLDQGLKLWVVHVLESEKTTRSFKRLFTTYDQLLKSPMETTVRLAHNLGLATTAVSTVGPDRIDTALRHYTKLSWPAGEPHEDLTLSIHQTLVSDEPDKAEKLDRLRKEYYSRMQWNC
jgi:hypothetical protein